MSIFDIILNAISTSRVQYNPNADELRQRLSHDIVRFTYRMRDGKVAESASMFPIRRGADTTTRTATTTLRSEGGVPTAPKESYPLRGKKCRKRTIVARSLLK